MQLCKGAFSAGKFVSSESCSGNELALAGCPIPYVDLTHTFSLTELRGFSTIESLIRVVFVPKLVFCGPRSRMAVTSRHWW